MSPTEKEKALERTLIPMAAWLSGLLLFFSYLSLAKHPLPWFDEVYFASITKSWATQQRLYPEVAPLMERSFPQGNMYGPIFFSLSGVLHFFIGVDPLTTRLPSFLALVGCVVVLGLLRYTTAKRSETQVLVPILFLVDPIIQQSSHAGRMDLLALFFVLLALRFIQNAHSLRAFGLAGILLGLAILTTPRAMIAFPGIGIYLTGKVWGKNEKIVWLAIPTLVCLAVFLSWIFWQHGDFRTYYQLLFSKSNQTSYYNGLASMYISERKYVPLYQLPLYALAFWILFRTIQFSRKLPLLVFCAVINLVFYFGLIKDTGLYSVFSIPWVWIIIAYGIEQIPQPAGRLFFKFTKPLLLLALLFWLVRWVHVSILWYSFSTEVSGTLKMWIQENDKVVGDDCFFYSVEEQGGRFYFLTHGGGETERQYWIQNECKPKWLLVDASSDKGSIIQNLKIQGHLKIKHHGSFPKSQKGKEWPDWSGLQQKNVEWFLYEFR